MPKKPNNLEGMTRRYFDEDIEPLPEPWFLPMNDTSVVAGSERPWPLSREYWLEMGRFMFSRPKKKRARRGLLDRRV